METAAVSVTFDDGCVAACFGERDQFTVAGWLREGVAQVVSSPPCRVMALCFFDHGTVGGIASGTQWRHLRVLVPSFAPAYGCVAVCSDWTRFSGGPVGGAPF